MAPTLRDGDQALGWLRTPAALRIGDVVIVELPGRPLSVKRVARVLADGSVWVEGDNPDGSTDSRELGPVRREQVRGRVIARVWPAPAVRGFRRSG